MEAIGFDVELDKSTLGRVNVPVLFGENGRVKKVLMPVVTTPLSVMSLRWKLAGQ